MHLAHVDARNQCPELLRGLEDGNGTGRYLDRRTGAGISGHASLTAADFESAEGVGRAANSAVVISSIMVFVIDLIVVQVTDLIGLN